MVKFKFDLTYSVKDFFFDRQRVKDALTEAEVKTLSRIGAYIRQTAQRTVLRRRQKVSSPGQPPSVHSSDSVVTLRNILFAYQPSQHAVIVGPVKLHRTISAFIDGSISVPQLLEFGGTAVIHEERRAGQKGQQVVWYARSGGRSLRVADPQKEYRTRVATYRARPFMAPALQIEIAKGTIRDAWRGSLVS